jgi:hypothetical protein
MVMLFAPTSPPKVRVTVMWGLSHAYLVTNGTILGLAPVTKRNAIGSHRKSTMSGLAGGQPATMASPAGISDQKIEARKPRLDLAKADEFRASLGCSPCFPASSPDRRPYPPPQAMPMPHDLEIEDAGFKNVGIETHGAHGRFGSLLFIEKEGFDSLLKSVRLADRLDIGTVSSKGNSVTAARMLADHLNNIPLFTLHDLDVAGFTIGQIGEDNRRYTYKNAIDVKNIGLRLDDILEIDGANIDDMAESVTVIKEKDGDDDDDRETKFANKREKLADNGATDDEINFLLGEGEFTRNGSRRIELNALTSRQLVDLRDNLLDPVLLESALDLVQERAWNQSRNHSRYRQDF